jgi:putative tricarboxylic transport membrane protein
MRHAVALTAIVALGLGGLHLAGALQYGRGALAHPGPGIFPLVVAVLLLVGAAGTAVEAMLSRDDTSVGWPRGLAGARVVGLAAATGAYVVLLPMLGHPLGGGLLALTALRIMGLRPWWWSLVVATALAGASHYLFTVGLGVPLPAGQWLD